MNLHVIDCGNFMVDGGAMFGVVPKTMWQKQYKANHLNLCNIKMRSLLIETGSQLVLIDTGAGNKQDARFFKYQYLNGDGELIKSLELAGFKPDDITDVVHTHLHYDHCGGTLSIDKKGTIVPTFKNANLWVSKTQWDWAINPNQREASAYPPENILPMAKTGKLKFVDNNCSLFDNIEVKLVNGHTRGQIIPIINYYDKKIIYCADLMPTMANVNMSYISAYDLFQLDVIDEKLQFLTIALENDMVLFFEHDIDIECCNLHKTEKGILPKTTFTLQQFKNSIERIAQFGL